MLPLFAAFVLQVPAPAPLEALKPLLGAWEGVGTGAPGEATGGSTYTLELDGRVLVRRNWAAYPAQGGRPAFRHEDQMVHYPEGGRIRALYTDNEGHVIHYTVTVDGPRITYLSDPAPGPRFRLTLTFTDPDTQAIAFEIAPPVKPEVFTPYLKAGAKRKRN